MFKRIKPLGELKAREIKIDFFEDEETDAEKPRVKLLHEIKRYSLA
ncbi:hypothetical protein [Thermococcus stetteri]|nr:hypothetical protein [Thermococcus stetteri]MBP1911745.1 hypothetical protein [Thermococcus stetteri]